MRRKKKNKKTIGKIKKKRRKVGKRGRKKLDDKKRM